MFRRARKVRIYVRNKQRYDPASKTRGFLFVDVEDYVGTTIADIKEDIRKQTKGTVRIDELFLNNLPLADDRSVAHYNLQNETILETTSNPFWVSCLYVKVAEVKQEQEGHPSNKVIQKWTMKSIPKKYTLIGILLNSKKEKIKQPPHFPTLDDFILYLENLNKKGATMHPDYTQKDMRAFEREYRQDFLGKYDDPLSVFLDHHALRLGYLEPEDIDQQSRQPEAQPLDYNNYNKVQHNNGRNRQTRLCEDCEMVAASLYCTDCPGGIVLCEPCSDRLHAGVKRRRHNLQDIKQAPKSNKPYVPRAFLAPFALTVAMYRSMTEGKLSLTEEEIKRRAQPLTDTDLMDKQNGRYVGGFDCMENMLIAKGLVKKEAARVPTYALTESGQILGEKLYTFYVTFNSFLQQHQFPKINNSFVNKVAGNRKICLIIDEHERDKDRLLSFTADKRIDAEVRFLPAGDYIWVLTPPMNDVTERNKVAGNHKICLIIDEHERDKDRLLSFAADKRIDAQVRFLPAGDYIWILTPPMHDVTETYLGNDTGNEMVLPFVVERKSWEDYENTLNSARYQKQINNMLSSGLQNCFYLMEGSLSALRSNTSQHHQQHLKAQVGKLTTEYGFYVNYTSSWMKSAQWLLWFSQLLIKGYNNGLFRNDCIPYSEFSSRVARQAGATRLCTSFRTAEKCYHKWTAQLFIDNIFRDGQGGQSLMEVLRQDLNLSTRKKHLLVIQDLEQYNKHFPLLSEYFPKRFVYGTAKPGHAWERVNSKRQSTLTKCCELVCSNTQNAREIVSDKIGLAIHNMVHYDMASFWQLNIQITLGVYVVRTENDEDTAKIQQKFLSGPQGPMPTLSPSKSRKGIPPKKGTRGKEAQKGQTTDHQPMENHPANHGSHFQSIMRNIHSFVEEIPNNSNHIHHLSDKSGTMRNDGSAVKNTNFRKVPGSRKSNIHTFSSDEITDLGHNACVSANDRPSTSLSSGNNASVSAKDRPNRRTSSLLSEKSMGSHTTNVTRSPSVHGVPLHMVQPFSGEGHCLGSSADTGNQNHDNTNMARLLTDISGTETDNQNKINTRVAIMPTDISAVGNLTDRKRKGTPMKSDEIGSDSHGEGNVEGRSDMIDGLKPGGHRGLVAGANKVRRVGIDSDFHRKANVTGRSELIDGLKSGDHRGLVGGANKVRDFDDGSSIKTEDFVDSQEEENVINKLMLESKADSINNNNNNNQDEMVRLALELSKKDMVHPTDLTEDEEMKMVLERSLNESLVHTAAKQGEHQPVMEDDLEMAINRSMQEYQSELTRTSVNYSTENIEAKGENAGEEQSVMDDDLKIAIDKSMQEYQTEITRTKIDSRGDNLPETNMTGVKDEYEEAIERSLQEYKSQISMTRTDSLGDFVHQNDRMSRAMVDDELGKVIEKSKQEYSGRVSRTEIDVTSVSITQSDKLVEDKELEMVLERSKQDYNKRLNMHEEKLLEKTSSSSGVERINKGQKRELNEDRNYDILSTVELISPKSDSNLGSEDAQLRLALERSKVEYCSPRKKFKSGNLSSESDLELAIERSKIDFCSPPKQIKEGNVAYENDLELVKERSNIDSYSPRKRFKSGNMKYEKEGSIEHNGYTSVHDKPSECEVILIDSQSQESDEDQENSEICVLESNGNSDISCHKNDVDREGKLHKTLSGIVLCQTHAVVEKSTINSDKSKFAKCKKSFYGNDEVCDKSANAANVEHDNHSELPTSDHQTKKQDTVDSRSDENGGQNNVLSAFTMTNVPKYPHDKQWGNGKPGDHHERDSKCNYKSDDNDDDCVMPSPEKLSNTSLSSTPLLSQRKRRVSSLSSQSPKLQVKTEVIEKGANYTDIEPSPESSNMANKVSCVQQSYGTSQKSGDSVDKQSESNGATKKFGLLSQVFYDSSESEHDSSDENDDGDDDNDDNDDGDNDDDNNENETAKTEKHNAGDLKREGQSIRIPGNIVIKPNSQEISKPTVKEEQQNVGYGDNNLTDVNTSETYRASIDCDNKESDKYSCRHFRADIPKVKVENENDTKVKSAVYDRVKENSAMVDDSHHYNEARIRDIDNSNIEDDTDLLIDSDADMQDIDYQPNSQDYDTESSEGSETGADLDDSDDGDEESLPVIGRPRSIKYKEVKSKINKLVKEKEREMNNASVIAKPRNSSLIQAGVERFCNNTNNMSDSLVCKHHSSVVIKTEKDSEFEDLVSGKSYTVESDEQLARLMQSQFESEIDSVYADGKIDKESDAEYARRLQDRLNQDKNSNVREERFTEDLNTNGRKERLTECINANGRKDRLNEDSNSTGMKGGGTSRDISFDSDEAYAKQLDLVLNGEERNRAGMIHSQNDSFYPHHIGHGISHREKEVQNNRSPTHVGYGISDREKEVEELQRRELEKIERWRKAILDDEKLARQLQQLQDMEKEQLADSNNSNIDVDNPASSQCKTIKPDTSFKKMVAQHKESREKALKQLNEYRRLQMDRFRTSRGPTNGIQPSSTVTSNDVISLVDDAPDRTVIEIDDETPARWDAGNNARNHSNNWPNTFHTPTKSSNKLSDWQKSSNNPVINQSQVPVQSTSHVTNSDFLIGQSQVPPSGHVTSSGQSQSEMKNSNITCGNCGEKGHNRTYIWCKKYHTAEETARREVKTEKMRQKKEEKKQMEVETLNLLTNHQHVLEEMTEQIQNEMNTIQRRLKQKTTELEKQVSNRVKRLENTKKKGKR